MNCRILIDAEPSSGAWNMAVDQVLLESAIESATCSVRVYAWREPTISLGHFQSSDAVCNHPRLQGLPLVRRLSGGGAILHHHELTYSCALPAGHPAIRNPTDLYGTVHAAIIHVLGEHGIETHMRGDIGAGDDFAFLCFSRGDPRDIVLNGCKILGSAQRRRRGAVLQHGSLLLKASEFAPEYPGLRDLVGYDQSASGLSSPIAHALAEAVSESRSVEQLAAPELQRVAELESASQS